MDQAPIGLSDQRLRFPTEYVTVGRVDEYEGALDINDGHEVRRIPEEWFEADGGDVAISHLSSTSVRQRPTRRFWWKMTLRRVLHFLYDTELTVPNPVRYLVFDRPYAERPYVACHLRRSTPRH